MALNYDQRIASKIMIRNILKISLKDEDFNRAMEIVDELFSKYRLRTDIYMDLKEALEKEFKIDPFTLYFVILKDIDVLFKQGLSHLDVFI